MSLSGRGRAGTGAWLCLGLLLWLAGVARAQDFQRISVDDGLPSATLYGITQDAAGFLWISGATGGLARFDGHDFRFVPLLDRAQSDGLLPDTGSVLLDRDNRLWVGSWGHGLFVISADRREITRFRHDPKDPDSLASDRVQSFSESADGSIWIGTTDGLNRYQPDGSMRRFSAQAGGIRLSDPRVWCIVGDLSDTLWVGTSDGLHRYRATDGGTAVFRPVDPQIAADRANEIRVLHLDQDGTLWVGTRTSISRFDTAREAFVEATSAQPVTLPPVSSILPDGDTHLLLGTQGGIFRLDRRRNQLLPFASDAAAMAALPAGNIRALLLDRSGVLWAATRENGLYRRIPGRQRFQSLRSLASDLPSALEAVSASALHRDASGALWIGSALGVAGIAADGGVQHLSLNDGAHVPGPISGLVSDQAGQLWIGSQQGLFRRAWDSGQVERVDTPFRAVGVSAPSVRALYRRQDGELLFGLWGRGALAWNPQAGPPRWLLDGLGGEAGDAVLAFAEAVDGTVFVGTRYSGLYEVQADGATVRNHQFDPAKGAAALPNNAVNALLIDRSGRLWVGTDQGLSRRLEDGSGFRSYGTADGLPDPRVVGVLQDASGLFWITTKRGLARFNEAEGSFVAFTRSDGLLASEFNRGALIDAGAGRVLAATVEGVNLFAPQQVEANAVAPQIALTEVLVDGISRELQDAADGAASLRLEHGRRSVSIAFVALDFQDVKRNRFRYRLQGFDEHWQPADRGRFATYTNLPQGRYRFEVLGSNNHGRWSAAPAALELVVEGPWWEHPLAQIGLALGALLLLLLGYRWRLHQHTLARLRLEQQVAAYAGELKAERDLFIGGPAVALIARLSPGWPLIYVSSNAFPLLGREAAELVGKGVSLEALVDPADREALREQTRRHVTEGVRSWEQRFRVLRPDGQVRGVYGFAVVQRDESGKPSALRGYLLDQTELLDAQRASEQFKSTLDRTRDAVIMLHADSLRLFYANQGACDQLGYERETLLQMRAHEVLASGAEAELRVLLEPLRATPDAAVTLRSEFRRRDGSTLPVEVFLQYIAPPGERPRFVAFVRDITERQRIERLKDEFVSTVSHELRTPLTSINGALGLAVGGALGPLPGPAQQLLQVAQRNAQRLRMLIDDLLDMEKLEAGQLRIELEAHPLLALVEQALESNRDYAAQWNITLELQSELAAAVRVSVDPARLQQVLSNLLSNAAKFSPLGGVVTVRLQRMGPGARITVADRGPGIPESFWPHLFEKFTQADASDTRQKGGTGLGLAISRRLVERMGGEISFATSTTDGTRFFIDLPLAVSADQPSIDAVH